MDIDSLYKLRTEIVERAQALALNGQVNQEDRLAVLMNLVRTGSASDEVIRAAFGAIDEIQDDDVKLETYFDLLYEVDQLIARRSNPEASSDTSAEVSTGATEPQQPQEPQQPEAQSSQGEDQPTPEQ